MGIAQRETKTLEDVRHLDSLAKRQALQHGFVLVTIYHGPGGKLTHWLLNGRHGGRVLDYWPGSGRWWSAKVGERGRVASWEELLKVAKRITSDVYVPDYQI